VLAVSDSLALPSPVYLRCDGIHVLRVDAERVAAEVVEMFVVKEVSRDEDVRDPVRGGSASWRVPDSVQRATLTAFAAMPDPASLRLLDAPPEPLLPRQRLVSGPDAHGYLTSGPVLKRLSIHQPVFAPQQEEQAA
jgi:hypothetical protein